MIVAQKPQLQQIPIELLKRGRYQPRRIFDSESLAELAESIRSSGLIQPIVVRQLGSEMYEIVAGERRWRAAQLAGLDTVSCLINQYSDEQAAAVATIENMQRKDLNPIEEAQSLQRLVDEFGYLHDEIAAIIGASRTKVTNSLRLLRLEPFVQDLLIQGQLNEGHGKILVSLPAKMQISLAKKCSENAWSVRRMEQEIKKYQNPANIQDRACPNIMRLERMLSEHLAAPVELDSDQTNSGWLKIRFYNNDTLAGLLKKIGLQDDDG